MLGWKDIQELAHELFLLKDATIITEATANKIVALWEKLPYCISAIESFVSSTT